SRPSTGMLFLFLLYVRTPHLSRAFLPENAVIFMPWDSAETKLRTFVLFYNAVCTMPQCPYRLPKTAPPPFLPHTINQQKEECICL
ncbi:hypothetical protein, partial [Ruminococcus callidus]|uniref:hypothetical protein n=1 Tax=Ruminococcus callidus TaxID=40519 RepID=UPI0023FA4885